MTATQYLSRNWRGVAQVLAMSFAALALTILVACSSDESEQTTEAPQMTATPAPAAPQATAAPTPTAAAPTPAVTPAARQTPAPTPAATPPPGPVLQVVSTTNFAADWVRNVGGERVEVFALLPPGGDPHTFLPGARDVARVADADIIFTVGLGLEADWLSDLIHNASADESKVITLGDSIDPIEFSGPDPHGHHDDDHDDHEDEDDHDHEMEDDHDDHEDEDDHDHDHEEDDHDDHEDEDDHDHEMEDDHDDHEDEDDHDHDHEEDDHEDEDDHDHEEDDHGHEMDGHDGHDHGPLDPHFWFDPIRVKIAVDEIAEHLAEENPQSADFFLANADAYKAELDELHAWTLAQVELIPQERRLLLTSHDSFSYFAKLYGFQIVGLVIPSLATHVEPSPEHIAGLVDLIREHNVPAVFGENTVDDRLVRAIALETGAKMFHLYTGSLGPEGSDGGTYLGMVRSNVEVIVEALK